MIEMDEWGRDPSVQAIRKIFKEMETCKNEILGRLGISPYDLRIRRWLEKALAIFEKAWEAANQMGVSMDEKIAPVVYVHCLAKAMGSEGTEIPDGLLPEEKEAERLMREIFK